jgi:hypothetical protein
MWTERHDIASNYIFATSCCEQDKKTVMMMHEMKVKQRTDRALQALVAGNTNSAGRWICQE